MSELLNQELLATIITGRVEPHIYAFTTNTIPNYLKVGDTYRPVSVRLKEWQIHYPNLEKTFEGKAKIEDVYFRDFSVHDFLEGEKHKSRLQPTELCEGIYYSKEFFKDTDAVEVQEAITDIQADYQNKTQKYQFYSVETLRPEETVFPRTETYSMRPNQEKTVNAFKMAIANGRKNLLMYAVMRFGKSFTSMCCAAEIGAKLVVVVSAKADVLAEWKRTVESHVKFDGYEFITAKTLENNNCIITDKLASGKKVVLFLTLQDLQGDKIKDKHQEVFGQDIDLLLVDETHFGARAEKFGKVLKNTNNYERDIRNKKDNDDFIDVDEAVKTIKTLKANITIHLSGTPYRILMGSEFKKEDIIAFYQFTDIVDEQKAWDEEHILDDECKEWDNPYYGFPQMVRFAFYPNKSSRQRLEELRKSGTTYAFSALFKSQSLKKTDDGTHKKFIYEKEILDLLEVIDGSKFDDELLGFLDYDKLKEGKMCRHIVIVLPYCASCDALEELIKTNQYKFRNLNSYEIVNISGVDKPNVYKSPKEIKTAISKHEENGKKTITLTVNRMLTGSTVPEWDTMLYLKDTASPQEYDQAIFRLQNQYIKTYRDRNGDTIKYNMKPQTLLVDFEPNRMFAMQEKKSKIYNVNVDMGGNTELEKRITKELEISPIITINKDKIERVVATNILEAVSNYQRNKGIKDEALELPVDLSILEDNEILSVIEHEYEIDSKRGLSVSAHVGENEGNGSELDVPEPPLGDDNNDNAPTTDATPPFAEDKYKEEVNWTKKVQSYYTRILLFAFITKDTVISLADIIAVMETIENSRIAKNLGLSKQILTLLNQKTNKFVLSDLDYKIQDLNNLSRATDLSPEERANVAVHKFGKLGDAIVITPSNICDDMVKLLPEDFIESLPSTNGKILDIAGTAGEFAVALYKRMTKLGLAKDFIKDSIFTVPKSAICYELTRKLYDMFGLNISNIAKEFSATDMLDIKIGNKVDYDKIKALLTQNKPFETIKLTDTLTEGDEEMNFDAVVGNPPYQEMASGDANGSDPMYHFFIDASGVIGERATLIHPARFLFNAGKTPKDWNKKILNNEHFKVIHYWPNSADVFPTVDIKGGVAVTLQDKMQNFGKIGIFVAHPELNAILGKVKVKDFSSFADLVYPRDLYRLTERLYEENSWAENRQSTGHRYDVGSNVFNIFPDLFFEEMPNDGYEYAKVYGRENNERIEKWIKKDYLKIPDNFYFYKIFIPKSNGSGAIGEVLSTPIVGEPIVGSTTTFLSVGKFDTEAEAVACLKYVKTKFCRAMLGTLKVTQDNPKPTWANVPLQDFTANSDIDWSKSVAEIDKQLYAKYALSAEEVEFIEKNVRAME